MCVPSNTGMALSSMCPLDRLAVSHSVWAVHQQEQRAEGLFTRGGTCDSLQGWPVHPARRCAITGTLPQTWWAVVAMVSF